MTVDWMVLAACRGTNVDMWETPSRQSGAATEQQIRTARQALNLCAVCPVVADCRANAGEVVGMIRAGAAYDPQGQPSPSCVRCGHVILGRGSRFCGEKCQHRYAYQQQRQRGQVAA